jgi:hypothetical protein
MRGRKHFSIVAIAALTFFCTAVLVPQGADARPPQRKRRAPRATTGKLAIFCFVKGAHVEIDGKKVATTPVKKAIQLKPGQYSVRVHKRGYYEVEERVVISLGKETEFDADLNLYAGLVQVTANVSSATVAIGGKLIGNTPLDKDIPAGKKELTVQADGYIPFRQLVEIRAGQKHFFNITLKPVPMIGSGTSGGILNKWWFWTVVGVVVAGGAAAGLVLGLGGDGPKNAPFSTDLQLK